MEVWVDTNQVECSSKTIKEFNDFWKETTGQIFRDSRFLYSVTIDDEKYYDGYETIIIEQFDKIGKIAIETKSEEQALEESIDQVREYNEKLAKAVNEVSVKFYGEPTPEDWGIFSQFIEGVHWLSHSLHFIQTISKKHTKYEGISLSIELVISDLGEKVQLLQSAVDQQDYILIGDIVQYEYPGLFERVTKLFGGSE